MSHLDEAPTATRFNNPREILALQRERGYWIAELRIGEYGRWEKVGPNGVVDGIPALCRFPHKPTAERALYGKLHQIGAAGSLLVRTRIGLEPFEPSCFWKGDDESGTRWIVLPGVWSDEEALNFWEDVLQLSAEGWTCHTHEGDCCGRWFGGDAVVTRTRTRTLIRQHMSRDI